MAQSDLQLGMGRDAVEKLFPGMAFTRYENTITFTRPENLFGVDGTWHYRFADDKLNWIHYDRYYQDAEMTSQNFDKCLAAVKELSAKYQVAYGKPDQKTIGETKFVNPYVKHHYGYRVWEERWKNYRGMAIDLQFTFFGGKGEYMLIVESNYLPAE